MNKRADARRDALARPGGATQEKAKGLEPNRISL
jgi:hypothetical protein